MLNTTIPDAIKVENADNAPVEEGKEMVAKIVELETKLKQSNREIQRLTEEMQNIMAQMDGLSANLAIAQSQAAEKKIPVNIQPPQPEITPDEPAKKE